MKEINDIIRSFDAAVGKGIRTALATVVHVEGSSYRRPGARMLITEEGQLTGAISGGCLEGDALRKALLVMSRQIPALVTYDTMDEDDATIGIGLGCNGIIRVLIEPIDPSRKDHPVELLRSAAERNGSCLLVTLFQHANSSRHPGTSILAIDGRFRSATADAFGTDQLRDAMAFCTAHRQSQFRQFAYNGEQLTAFIEYVESAASIVVFGAGNDVIPLVSIAELLGWNATVIDGRPAYAKKERFTGSCQVMVAKPADVLQQLGIEENTAYLLMTHNYNYDKALLPQLLAAGATYVGMLGPKKKLDRMLAELHEEGNIFTPDQLARIHSPVGLDIGAETAEEIALSIVAEIKAVRSGRKGLSLTSNTGSIHSRPEILPLSPTINTNGI